MACRYVIVALLGCAAVPALAQEQSADSRTRYEAAFFAQFAPSTALQMVERLPGFTIEESDTEVRGFAQAAGNVVIDGQRPSTKSEPLDTVLSRIPANRVLQIEVGPGEAFGSEYSGKAQVANIVLAAGGGGLAGTLEGEVRRAFDGRVLPEASGSLLLRRGKSTFNVAAALDNDQTSEEGTDTIVALPSFAPIEFREKVNTIRDPNGYVSASWEHNDGANRTAHLNGRFALDRFRLDQTNRVTPAIGTVRDDTLSQKFDRRDFEIGGDVTRPLGGGGLKLIGLATRRHRENAETVFNVVQGAKTGGFVQLQDSEREESLARVTWNRAGLSGWNVEIGAEGALNRLRSDVDLFGVGAGGVRTRIDLPVDQATVKEYRGEAFVNAGRAVTKTLRADAGLTYEASRLTVRGDAQAERTLKFLKPKLVLDWRPSFIHAQLSIQRTVAQLQFEEFISAAELATDRVNGGNANLLPQRAWEVLATFDRPILGDGLVKLELGFNQISLVQDRVPTPEGFDAPGNLGSGQSYIARGTIDAPLSRFGIKGGRLTLYGSIVETSVRDPYTFTDRRFSGNSLAYFKVDFRQDLGKFAWGLTLEGSSPSTAFRRNELDTFYSALPQSSIFAEYRPSKTTTVTLGANNVFDRSFFRERQFFTPSRIAANPNAYERRVRDQHIVPYLTLKHSFG